MKYQFNRNITLQIYTVHMRAIILQKSLHSFCILNISNDKILQQNTRMEKHFLEIIGYVAFVDNVFIGRNVNHSTFNVSHYILHGGVPKYNVRETSNK